ncbi:HAD family hydrolase [Antarcticimicrobium luteum]|uniref:phosphoglycolate phosphatase n=1 Tax=Antarcticimicrobium luteum TaxID=2547397 RepID=A0A4R5VGH8_9RHOB|nr:HAD family hydrolase [Antarcticimicrobium luteum]TDK52356.1 HAD family hydrolase [Antarcticimicrobium luteum]
MTIDAILFDKDGTLFDFGATWEAWAEAFLLRATGQDRPRARAIGAEIGFDLEAGRFDPSSVVIAGTPAEVAGALGPHFPHMSPAALIDMLNEEAERAPQIEAVPLAPFLDGLRGRGLRLGVATNDAEAPARAHLGAARVLDRFDFIAGFDSGHGAKPEPGPLLAFCAAVDVDPARAVMVGDSTHDLHAGRAAGMLTLGVLTGMAAADELAPHADAVLPDIGHIPAWLTARG